MRTVLLLALVFLFVSPANNQETPAKLAQLFIHPNFLYADGVWRPDDLTEKTEMAFDSVTRLECYKHGGMDLVGVEAYCMQATASIVGVGVPDISVDYFPVIAWDRDKVIAADSSTAAFPICTWTQITANLQDHSIMATDTRKLGKGHEGFLDSCKQLPLAQTYHLVDKIEEITRRRLRAERTGKEKK
jgi:hypothetical protein